MQDYRIVAAIINCFFCELYSDRDNEKEIVTEIKIRIRKNFIVKRHVFNRGSFQIYFKF
jgi:hypothetical protein